MYSLFPRALALLLCRTVLGIQTETSLSQTQVELGLGQYQHGSFKSVLYMHDPFDASFSLFHPRASLKANSPLPYVSCSMTLGIVLGVFVAIILLNSVLNFFPHWWTKSTTTSGDNDVLWDTHRAKAIWTLVCYIGALNVAIQLEFLFSLFVQQAMSILSADESSVNYAFTIFLVCNGLAGPFFAKLASKCGMKLMMLTSLVGTIVTYAGLCVLPNLFSFYACYLLGGLSMACLYSTCSISSMRVMPPHLQSLVVGLLSCMNMGLSAVISVAIKPIIHSLGIRMGYGILGAFMVIMLVIFTVTLPREGDRLCIEPEDKSSDAEIPESEDDAGLSFCAYLKLTPLYLVFFIDMLGMYFWEGQFQVILNQTQARYSMVRQIGAPVLFFLCACSRFVWGAIAAMTSAMLCMTAASAAFAVSFVIWALTLGNSIGTLLGLILTAVTMASHCVLMPIMVMRTVDKKSATFFYSILMTAELGGISAPLSAGLFDTLGPRGTLLACCGAPALSTALKFFTIKWDKATIMKKSR